MAQTNQEKIEFLKNKGLQHGDEVLFDVENPCNYWGPRKGKLVMNDEKCYIEGVGWKGEEFIMSINEWLGAYINTIEKISSK